MFRDNCLTHFYCHEKYFMTKYDTYVIKFVAMNHSHLTQKIISRMTQLKEDAIYIRRTLLTTKVKYPKTKLLKFTTKNQEKKCIHQVGQFIRTRLMIIILHGYKY